MAAGTLIVAAIVVLGALGSVGYILSLYNGLVEARNNIDKAFQNIDVLLQRRHDELSKLLDVVQAYIKHERDTLEKVTRLRTEYRAAVSTDRKVDIENELNRQVTGLKIQAENYPDLKASANFLQLQQSISALESSIADRRELFNDSVNLYNIQCASVPQKFMARAMGCAPHAFLEIPPELKADVKIALA